MEKRNQDVELDAKVWGPHFWYFLHTISLGYPHNPTSAEKRQYYNLVQNLPLFLPVSDISKSFGHLLDMYPVTPFLDSRESFVRWMHFVHNKINQKLEKPVLSIEGFYKEYYEAYKPIRLLAKESGRYMSILKHVFICGILLAVIVYLQK